MSEPDLRHDLVRRIEDRRAAVRAYLRRQRPRTRRLANATIVLSSLAAVFTAGPAVGGENFSGGVQRVLGLSSDSFVWRALCLAALLVSVGAALLTNVGRSQEAVTRLSTAEAVSAELEGLATLVQFGHLPLEDAVKLYQDYTVKIPFVEDAPELARS
jgi:cytochrome bd-type quinol oxidase subunit 2